MSTSVQPNLQTAPRDVATQVLVMLAIQAVLLALGWTHGWWGFVLFVFVAVVPLRLVVMLCRGARSKPEDAPRA